MEVSSRAVGEVTVVEIRGSVDGLTSERLSQHFNEQVSGGRVRLVADCAALEYTSSAGLRTLLGTLKAARQKGGDLRLAGVRPAVLNVLELSGFTSILKTYPDVQGAVASFAA
jgi:anti-sigma B factor antagonist